MLKDIIPNKWIRFAIGLSISVGGYVLYRSLDFPLAIVGLLVIALGVFLGPSFRELFGGK